MEVAFNVYEEDLDPTTPAEIELIDRLSRDLKQASAELTHEQARYLVDLYYQMQHNRITAKAQSNEEVPSNLLNFFTDSNRKLENNIKACMGVYAAQSVVGKWSQGIVGIGPVLSAGLIAHIDVAKCRTAGAVWRFAGMDPSQEWYSAQKAKDFVTAKLDGRKDVTDEDVRAIALDHRRSYDTLIKMASRSKDGKPRALTATTLASALAMRPWNARLKVICWKIGESFVKTQNRDGAFYGKLYAERKALEVHRNEAGHFAAQAAAKLERINIGKGTDAYKAYSQGKLPPAHLHARARRIAVKVFLEHWFQVAYMERHGVKAPPIYVTEQMGHVHYIECPDWPF